MKNINQNKTHRSLKVNLPALLAAVLCAAVIMAVGVFIVIMWHFPFGSSNSNQLSEDTPKFIVMFMVAIITGIIAYVSVEKPTR